MINRNDRMLKKSLKSIWFRLILALLAVSFTTQSAPGQPENPRVEAMKAALAKNPESAAANFELAKQYYTLQQSNDAQRYFLAVIGLDPQHAEAYAYLGHIFLNQEKFPEAITFFQQALKWQPDNQLALTGLKQIQTHQNLISQLNEVKTRIAQEKWQDAHRQLLEIPMLAKKLPQFRELRQEVAQYFYEQGNLHFRSGDWKTAQSFFSQLLELLPDYLDSTQKLQLIVQNLNSQSELEKHYQSGNRAFQRQNWPEALRLFEKILKLDRNYKDTQQKWQIAFAARDAELAVVAPPAEDSVRPVSELTEIVSPVESDSIQFRAQTTDTLSSAKPTLLPVYLNILQSYHYWFSLLALFVAGFLFRQFRRKRPARRKRKPQPVAPRVNETSATRSAGALAQPILNENTIQPVPAASGSLPASPYKRFELKQEVARFDPIYVYLAQDRRLNRQVLIDRVELKGKSKNNAKQIIAGVQTAANLNHPHIIRVEDVFFQDEVVFIVMEHVPGISLNELLTGRKPGELLKSIQIIRACCLALSYAHRHDVFHANLHPFYIKIINDETIKLGGFELATFRSLLPKEPTGQLSDFVVYQAPEQLRDGLIDARSDIFSLGIIFYELLTLNNPFQGESNAAVVFNILEGNPISPREINPDIPQKLDRLVMKMLAKNRGDRFFNAVDVALELKKYL
jgi:tetratricopeptide (TPR) repeat protein